MNVELMVKNWQNLIHPRRIDVDDSLSDTYGRFDCAPLERGFGLTIGNAVRRVLLSALRGAAITPGRLRTVSTSKARNTSGMANSSDNHWWSCPPTTMPVRVASCH